jgi:gamma-glutamylcyclotransferase
MLLFAYGALMDPRRMRRLCPGARPDGTARLRHHAIAFTRYSRSEKGGVADVVPALGESVWGALYVIRQSCLAALDRYENAPQAYRRETLVVIDEQGAEHEATVYVANRTGEFAPSRAYRDLIVRGARERGLPDEYVQGLEAVRPHS